MQRQTKKKILFIADGVSMAHPTRMFQLCQSLDPAEFEIHFATTEAYFPYFDFQKFHIFPEKITSIPNQVFNARLFKAQLPITLEELNQFCHEDTELIQRIKPDLIISDFRLSLKGTLAQNPTPWINLIQYHWHPDYHKPYLVPPIQPVFFLGRKLAEKMAPWVTPLILKRQLSLIHRFEETHKANLSQSLFHFYCSGHHLLFPDLPELFNQVCEIPGGTFIGPIIWTNSKISWPTDWPSKESLSSDSNLKKAYVSMGSTGNHNLTPHIVESLLSLEYQVFLSLSGSTKKQKYPDTVKAAHLVPADDILQISDLLVCNGGTSTTYHSLSFGVPIFALSANMDQTLHMDILKKNNIANYLLTDQFNSSLFKDLIDKQNITNFHAEKLKDIKKTIQIYREKNIFLQTIRRFL